MSPDGRRVVSGSCCDGEGWKTPGVLKVWNVETRECVATLKGHSDGVCCGVHCTFVMIWLRCRSRALPCLRTGGASCLGVDMVTARSRCGTWRPASAWRRSKGTRTACVAASAVLLW